VLRNEVKAEGEEATMVIEWIVSGAVLIGACFVLVGSIGLMRFPDFFSRLHAPTKATTLGLGAMLTASMLHFGFSGEGASVHELLIILFLFLSAPVSAHLMAKAAQHLGQGAGEGKRQRR
jgi:multicomponent K+:H+ antiporter subunit G